jgi:hypothetical protein
MNKTDTAKITLSHPSSLLAKNWGFKTSSIGKQNGHWDDREKLYCSIVCVLAV